jgi:hypothetical protein
MKNKLLVPLLAAAMMIFVAGCTLPTGGGPGPRVWIDTPLNGDLLAFGAVVVKSHVSSEGGTASAALLVNGVQVRVDTPTSPSDPLTSFVQVWEPASPGDYGLEVVATDLDGNTGRSFVRVRISAEAYIPPMCRLDQLVAPESLEPADGATVVNPVHFAWSYPETVCHPSSFAVSISEPDGSADISGIGWGSITYDWLTTFRNWRLPDGACYYWRTLVDSGTEGFGPPSEVRRFCIPSLSASLPGSSTVTASVPLPVITINPSVIPNLFPTFVFTKNANCRLGPDTAYAVVTSFFAGDQVTLEGRNNDSSWYWALIPNSNSHCWISDTTGSPQGPIGGLVVVPAPALPATTVAPPPVVIATTPAPVAPAAPGGFSVSTQSCTSSEYVVTLQWSNVTGELGYRIYRDGALIATLPENSTSYNDASPDYNSHAYQVQSFNNAGSANSSVQNSEGCLY